MLRPRRATPALNPSKIVCELEIMLWKPIFILLLTWALWPQTSDERRLPEQLSETETQLILKERNPKPHVEAALRVSDARLLSAVKNTEASQFQTAVQDIDVYAALIFYADAYTRKLSGQQHKERSNCLKKLEQAVFKQTRSLDVIERELPYEFRDSVLIKISEVKKVRLRALNDLLGDGKFMNSSNE
jgi:hypothetical protein